MLLNNGHDDYDPADGPGKVVLSVKVFFSTVSGRQDLTLRESV